MTRLSQWWAGPQIIIACCSLTLSNAHCSASSFIEWAKDLFCEWILSRRVVFIILFILSKRVFILHTKFFRDFIKNRLGSEGNIRRGVCLLRKWIGCFLVKWIGCFF